ncbi:MAG TPA: formyltransferase family protein [Fibrobacteraceae bacterium]|nr:formyltransferase family protein [Fibrobacteraceae bacterium]
MFYKLEFPVSKATSYLFFMLKIGFMASGGGSNFQAILNHIQDGSLANVTPAVLITNNSRCGAATKAQAAGIPVHHISSITHPDPEERNRAMLQIVNAFALDLLVLAGYMKQIPDLVLERLPHRIVNIHPALLPSFGGTGLWGHYVHEAVVAAGARVSGPTVHFVDGNTTMDALSRNGPSPLAPWTHQKKSPPRCSKWSTTSIGASSEPLRRMKSKFKRAVSFAKWNDVDFP